MLGLEEVHKIFNDDGEPVVLDETTDEGRKQKKLQELNELAYSELILAMDTRKSAGNVAFNIVKRSKTKNFTDGNAADAWKGLQRKYAPTSALSLAKISKQFYDAKLKEGVDPDVFITYLEDLHWKMDNMETKITDEQFMVQVLNNLNKDYEIQVAKIEDRVGAKDSPATIEEMRDLLCLKYERMNNNVENSNDDGEKALAAVGQFKGWCQKCGKYGHKGADCRSKNNNNDKGGNDNNKRYNEFTGKCHHCGIIGHKKKDCRKLKRE